MSNLFNNDFQSVKFLVAKGNQSFASAAGGIYPSTGNSQQLADGQLAVVSWDDNGVITKGNFLTATNGPGSAPNEVDDVRFIRLAQGTARTTDITSLDVHNGQYSIPNLVLSDVIDGTQDISFVGQVQAGGTRSAYVVGAELGGTSNIPLTEGVQMNLNMTFTSQRRTRYFGSQADDGLSLVLQTPVWSTIGLTTDAAKLDWIVQQFVYRADASSKYHRPKGRKPFIAFAIDINGGGTGTALSAISAGTPFNYITKNGVTYSYTPDAEFVNTITAAIANSVLAGTSEIGVVNLSSAGSQAHDAILLVALDESESVVMDRVQTNKVVLNVGLNEAMGGLYATTNVEKASDAVHSTGTGRFWDLEFKKLADKQIWSQQWVANNTNDLISPSPVDVAATYNVYIIESYAERKTAQYHTERVPSKTVLLIPATSGASSANTLASLNGVLAPWLLSCTSIVENDMPGTSPNIFA